MGAEGKSCRSIRKNLGETGFNTGRFEDQEV